MTQETQFEIVRKDLKHARIKVNENGLVRIVIPFSFAQEDVEALIRKKTRWIDRQKAFFAKKSRIDLARNQLLLRGNRYNYFYEPGLNSRVLINEEFKTIRASIDLLDLPVQEKWYRNLARKNLVCRILALSKKLNLPVKKVFIRGQKTKLGNCSEEKNISLNWRLIKAPEVVSDYIIVHELVHTRIMSHSSKFWTYLKSLYPDYQIAIDWLEKYGNSL